MTRRCNLRVAFDRTYFVGSLAWGFSLSAHNFYKAFEENGVWKIGSYSRTGKLEKVLDSGEIANVLAGSGEKALTADEARRAGRRWRALVLTMKVSTSGRTSQADWRPAKGHSGRSCASHSV